MHFLPEKIDDYVVEHSQQEPKILKELTKETWQKIINPRMLSGAFQGRVLSMISKLVQPKNILEIGTYTGYSAICIAEGISDDGSIDTIDKNEELVDLQNKYFEKSGFRNKIFQHVGSALEIIPTLNKKFDLVFIDADKSNYSNYFHLIIDKMNPYTISYTQKEAGFESSIKEKVLFVDAPDKIHSLCSKLKKDLVVEGSEEVILADTSVKLMQKLHQMYSGTVKFESGNSMVLDLFKAQYIYDNFCCNKIGIFYKFKEELNAIKEVYGDQVCTDLEEFNETSKSIALQIVSGREGISLRKAKYLIYYNIDFSATSYWQSRDRMTTKERLENEVFWIFTEGGIESKIYKSVSKKKDYTLNHFKRDLLTLN